MLRKLYFVPAVILALLAITLISAQTSFAAPDNAYVVNSSADTDDGLCNASNCTLREAINAANTNAGLDTINFNIGGCSCIIYPLTGLPTITDPVIINGYTEAGAAPTSDDNPAVIKIALRGFNAPLLTHGLRISSGGTTVKGLAINGFDGAGIWLRDNGGNTISGNFIGLFSSGTGTAPNRRGILISSGSGNNTIGGLTYDARNYISGNTTAGIEVNSGDGPADGNIIVGNIIGLNANEDPAGNGTGIVLQTKKNKIGNGSSPFGANYIAANLGAGIEINGPDAKGNVIRLNVIGSLDGANKGNGTFGILLQDGANKNKIGTSASFNYIYNNGADGIAVLGATTRRNTFRGNRIDANGGLGIDLNNDGITANDNLDADGGANQLQNFPVINSVKDGKREIKGKFAGAPNSRYTLDFYITFMCDVTGSGEGTYFETATITTDAAGKAGFVAHYDTPFNTAYYVSAIATDRQGNSSEFSKCKQLVLP